MSDKTSKADQIRALRETNASTRKPSRGGAVGRRSPPSGDQRKEPPPPRETRSPGRPLAKDAHLTLEANKPWLAEGVSRRTWYRRQKAEQPK